MYKLILVASCFAIIVGLAKSNHTKRNKTFNPTKTPIALVKLKDTIYHCQEIVATNCGYTINCGTMTVHCVKDIQIEYLH